MKYEYFQNDVIDLRILGDIGQRMSTPNKKFVKSMIILGCNWLTVSKIKKQRESLVSVCIYRFPLKLRQSKWLRTHLRIYLFFIYKKLKKNGCNVRLPTLTPSQKNGCNVRLPTLTPSQIMINNKCEDQFF